VSIHSQTFENQFRTRKVSSSILLAFAVLALCSFADSQANGDQSDSPAALAARIQRGDGTAVLEAGNSGNISYVAQLLTLRRKPGKNVSLAQIQLALAKLGQRAELQEIRCEALFGSASIQYDAVTDKLKYVGGWFSIETISSVLNNPDYRTFQRDAAGTFAPLGWYALKMLPVIIPNPPEITGGDMVPGSPGNLSVQRAWKEWIEVHKESLGTIEPSGAGLETCSRVCSKVLKHDRTFDHKAIKCPCWGDVSIVPNPNKTQ